ncbi:MAG: NUDIX domain-containing protein [Flavobacteriaceae bacterium]|nr:NUDIX domain-containing protein [Flavobacteriaceae bacterium]
MNTQPKHIFKHCLRCGSGAVTYSKDNALYCNACKFQYFVNSATAVALLITNEKGELLLTKRAFEPHKGSLDLPGGFVDIGESAEEAVQRELQEELNIQPSKMRYIASYPNEYVYSGLTVYTLDMAFGCEIANFTTIKANDDVIDFAFYPLDTIDLDKITLKSIRRIVEDFIKRNS